jgi:hypothetical protein
MVLFTNNRKMGVFIILDFFVLMMTDQVKYLEVILDKKLDWKTHLANRMREACIANWQCRRNVGKTWRLSPKVMAWIYTSVLTAEAHYFVCFAGMVEESGADKCPEKCLSLAADNVFGNYWYAFSTNVCFRSYFNVANLKICS